MNASVETIWDTFHARLSRFVRRRLPDGQSADDVLQEVYLKIHAHAADVRDEERMSGWVYQIARNAIHDFYRAQKPEHPIHDEIPLLDDNDPLTEDAADDIARRLAVSVRAMIDQMPADYREALILTEYEGMSQKELAEHLGLSLSGAKSRVQRGRKLLREMLLACCHFQFDRLGAVIDYYPRCGCCSDRECSQ